VTGTLFFFFTNQIYGIFQRDSLKILLLLIRVGDPDPLDPHVFGPPGSGTGSISQRCGLVEQTEIMPAK
jgi:hypothetical protein